MPQQLTVGAFIQNRQSGAIAGSKGRAKTTAGDRHDDRRITVGITEFTFTISTEVVNAGSCLIANLDPTNFIEVGWATTDYKLKIPPLSENLLSLQPACATLYLKADTAPCDVQVRVQEA